jgi:hypothetical protein
MKSPEFGGGHSEENEKELAKEFGLSVEELTQLQQEVEDYREKFTEPPEGFSDKTVDELLARYFEASQELDPGVRSNLRRWVRKILGIREDTE